MRYAFAATSLLLSACATEAVQSASRAWELHGYAGFSESVDALVGPGAIDCGFFELTAYRPVRRVARLADQCVRNALQKGLTFKYGTERIPIDSVASEVIARTADGKLWMIVFDIMIDGDTPQQWNQICEEVGIDPRTMIINAARCVEQSNGRLVIE